MQTISKNVIKEVIPVLLFVLIISMIAYLILGNLVNSDRVIKKKKPQNGKLLGCPGQFKKYHFFLLRADFFFIFGD